MLELLKKELAEIEQRLSAADGAAKIALVGQYAERLVHLAERIKALSGPAVPVDQ